MEATLQTPDGPIELVYNPVDAIGRAAGATLEYRDGHRTDPCRYEFPDGSAIVVAGDGWDIEASEPFSWRGA